MFRKQFLGLSCICSPVEILPYIEKIDKLDFSVVYLVNFFLLGKKSHAKIQSTVSSKRWLMDDDYTTE